MAHVVPDGSRTLTRDVSRIGHHVASPASRCHHLGSGIRPCHSTLLVACGILYVMATTACSLGYLFYLSPSMSNDHWWPDFNTTGLQTFLSDVFNTDATTTMGGDDALNLFGTAIPKDYASVAYIAMRPPIARRLLLDALALDVAVAVVRRNDLYENLMGAPASCWLDYTRTFEMAHTAKHQQLCAATKTTNAAVYFDSLLRNLNGSDLLLSTNYPAIRDTIFAAVALSPGGPAWVDATESRQWLQLADEIAVMHRHGLTYWKNQLHNLYHDGLEIAITITNALGSVHSFKTHRVLYAYRGQGAWSTQFSTCGLWTDLDTAAQTNTSLVRSAPNAFETMGFDWDVYYDGPTETIGSTLIRSTLGPLVAIDVTLVPLPRSLLMWVAAFRTRLYETSTSLLAHVPEPMVDAVPLTWQQRGMLYFGGNPLCPFHGGQPFVQPSFSYYDDCGVQEPRANALERPSLFFALTAAAISVADVASICRACPTTADACVAALDAALPLASLVAPTLSRKAIIDVVALNLSMLQFAATANGTPVLLLQSLVGNDARDPWTFFGWTMVYEWVDGLRELYLFEGDIAAMTLLSRRHDFFPLAANTLELPHSGSLYFWALSTYVTGLLGLFAVVVLVVAVGFHADIVPQNLFFVNRLIGSVWIGRPILVVRGLTAAILLSTSPVALVSDHGVTRLSFQPRPLLASMVIAGEATWLTYVLNDVLVLATGRHTVLYATLSAMLSWTALVVVDLVWPYQASATSGLDCTIVSFRMGLRCSNGNITIGDSSRLHSIVVIQIVAVALAYVVVRMLRPPLDDKVAPAVVAATDRFFLPGAAQPYYTQHVLVPGTPKVYIATVGPHQADDAFDPVGNVMCGIVPLGRRYMFDIKLWVVFRRQLTSRTLTLSLVAHTQRKSPSAPRQPSTIVTAAVATTFIHPFDSFLATPRGIRLVGGLGLAVMVLLVLGSYAFFRLASSAITNDFLWVGFDATNGAQAHVCNWFNANLQLPTDATLRFDGPAEGALAPSTGDSATTDSALVFSSPLYASAIQDEANALTNVVAGLRRTDPCLLPYIATAYCYVDFNRQWSLAVSDGRQVRCAAIFQNGAVYLEAMLRNIVDWSSFGQCWGDALDTAVLSYVRESDPAWLVQTMQPPANGIADEVRLWVGHGILSYTTQWQNYKTIGIMETFGIVSAIGFRYPLTLKRSNWTFQFSSETSRKMYWTLAGDLTAVGTNASTVAGLSLVRNSPRFAYRNVTPVAAMLANGTLVAPLDPAYVLLQLELGPFGSVDLTRVAVPPQLGALYRVLGHTVVGLLTSDPAVQAAFGPIYKTYFLSPQPPSWDVYAFWGGNLLCPVNVGGFIQPLVFFSQQGLCGVYLIDTLTTTTPEILKAILAASLVHATADDIAAICARDMTHHDSCVQLLTDTTAFLEAFPTNDAASIAQLASTVKRKVAATTIELVQYVTAPDDVDGANVSLVRMPFFSEPLFELFTWLHLFAWVTGTREVVAFYGECGTITTLSAENLLLQDSANPTEVPTSLAVYSRSLVQYITVLLLAVACVVCVYIVHAGGYIEGLNMISFNLVAGHVWIGRPLLFLRGLVALSLLATATLEYTHTGAVAMFDPVPRYWLTTLLSSVEATWLVYTITDLFSISTSVFTHGYSLKASTLVCVVSATWSLASPTTATVVVARVCAVEAVDFQVVCDGGTIEIGSPRRFQTLVAAAALTCLGCYVVERLNRVYLAPRVRNFSTKALAVKWTPPPPPPRNGSNFLYAAAQHEFAVTHWVFRDVYYLDKASAVLAGLLSLEWSGTIYIFDAKLWRMYALAIETLPLLDPALPPHLRRALPLVE
ncbi:Aste57867_10445 [Aphanomyces stellatus]|uniref:Aste57867_10445 protein n=1 Tax=Aphanomyces stellatus TaxID=120398 RepID=A0A485KRG1_9STRA|nr:hypothetical protein As57867_010405 [Aphanomyces stellatus]VFT87319.1 Aste57867_10445 [Aphanomyces stellatus]